MDRTEDDGNLYSVYKAQRLPRKERDCNLAERFLHPDLAANSRVTINKYQGSNYKRGLLRNLGEQPFPVQPKIGPYEVNDVQFGSKNYYWCSCGMSKKQPFCDSSHAGTNFKPLKFSLDERVDSMHLCGCKLSSNAPFCDGSTCAKLLRGERITVAEADLIDEEEEEDDTTSADEAQAK